VTGAGQTLRLHAFLPASRANGPGLRAVVWVQGCTLACTGCFNPDTHTFAGDQVGVDEVVERIVATRASHGIEGLTVSGGEPLQQRHSLRGLLGRIRAETDLSVVVFTGYSWDEVAAMPGSAGLLAAVDVLIAGRYEQSRRVAAGLRGSANKTIRLLSDRYTLADFDAVPAAEVVIDGNGDVILSGINPLER
jgi:anaerobic ribonucleoside-triphosphate reductase activating protein